MKSVDYTAMTGRCLPDCPHHHPESLALAAFDAIGRLARWVGVMTRACVHAVLSHGANVVLTGPRLLATVTIWLAVSRLVGAESAHLPSEEGLIGGLRGDQLHALTREPLDATRPCQHCVPTLDRRCELTRCQAREQRRRRSSLDRMELHQRARGSRWYDLLAREWASLLART